MKTRIQEQDADLGLDLSDMGMGTENELDPNKVSGKQYLNASPSMMALQTILKISIASVLPENKDDLKPNEIRLSVLGAAIELDSAFDAMKEATEETIGDAMNKFVHAAFAAALMALKIGGRDTRSSEDVIAQSMKGEFGDPGEDPLGDPDREPEGEEPEMEPAMKQA